MTIYATAITPSSCQAHESIEGIRWLDSENSVSNVMSTRQTIEWIDKGHRLWVAGAAGAVEVQVVRAQTPYLRTVANNSYTDNLLSLPRY